jgi:hypothetical protein
LIPRDRPVICEGVVAASWRGRALSAGVSPELAERVAKLINDFAADRFEGLAEDAAVAVIACVISELADPKAYNTSAPGSTAG